MDFQAVARLNSFRAQREKNGNFANKVYYAGSNSQCISAGSQNFPDRPRLTGSLLQRNCDGTDIWMLVCFFLWEWGASLWCQPHGNLRLKNDVQASTFKQCETLRTQNFGKAIFFRGRKVINKECVFRHLSSRTCLASKMWDLQACPEEPTTRVRAVCLPALSDACKHIPSPHCNCPWGSRLRYCVWECWMPYCGHLIDVTFPYKWACSKELWSACLLQKSKRVGQSYQYLKWENSKAAQL